MLSGDRRTPERRGMPQAKISIDVSARDDFVDARDWQNVLSQTLKILEHLIQTSEPSLQHSRIRWQISEASLSSPLHVTLSEFSIDQNGAASQAVRSYIRGLEQLESEETSIDPPPFFDEVALRSTRSLLVVLRRGVRSMTFSAPGLDP